MRVHSSVGKLSLNSPNVNFPLPFCLNLWGCGFCPSFFYRINISPAFWLGRRKELRDLNAPYTDFSISLFVFSTMPHLSPPFNCLSYLFHYYLILSREMQHVAWIGLHCCLSLQVLSIQYSLLCELLTSLYLRSFKNILTRCFLLLSTPVFPFLLISLFYNSHFSEILNQNGYKCACLIHYFYQKIPRTSHNVM